MDRETLLLINAATIVVYAAIGHALRKLAGLRSSYHVFQYAVPAMVVIVMLVIFRFMRGVTTAQHAAGDPGLSVLLTLWTVLWPVILFALPLVGAFQLAWSICALFRKGRLLLAPLSFLGLGVLCQTFYTVAVYFLSA